MLMRIFVIFILAIVSIPAKVQAQAFDTFTQVLNDFNSIKPLQNPNWERSRDTLKNNILDNKNKVVGNLNDIILSPEGSISSLNVDLNRLQLGEINLNYSDLGISASTSSYKMGYDDGQIEDVYPELLANIETAAGNTGDSISVKNLVGSDVTDDTGRRIAKVEEVLFSESGDRAEAILVRVNYKTVRGESVAMPFSSVEYQPNGGRFDVKVTKQQADTILKFADDM